MNSYQMIDGDLYLDGAVFSHVKAFSVEDKELPDDVIIHHSLSDKAEFSCEVEMEPYAVQKLFGFDPSKMGDCTSATVEFAQPYLVQRRRHKKRRINKKWAKRYGYITKFHHVILKDVEMVPHGEEIDIVGRECRYDY